MSNLEHGILGSDLKDICSDDIPRIMNNNANKSKGLIRESKNNRLTKNKSLETTKDTLTDVSVKNIQLSKSHLKKSPTHQTKNTTPKSQRYISTLNQYKSKQNILSEQKERKMAWLDESQNKENIHDIMVPQSESKSSSNNLNSDNRNLNQELKSLKSSLKEMKQSKSNLSSVSIDSCRLKPLSREEIEKRAKEKFNCSSKDILSPNSDSIGMEIPIDHCLVS